LQNTKTQQQGTNKSIRHFFPKDWEADVPTIPKYTASANLMAAYPVLDTPSKVYDPQQQPFGRILH